MGLLGYWGFEDLSPGGIVMDEKPPWVCCASAVTPRTTLHALGFYGRETKSAQARNFGRMRLFLVFLLSSSVQVFDTIAL